MPAVSGSHADLVALFNEFRELIKPGIVDGVPDFTAAAMARQHDGLKELQARLTAMDVAAWPVAEQVDYHVVRAEMNGVDFDHRVLRPWARDPGFYNLSDGIYPRLLVHHSRSLSSWGLEKPALPLDEAGVRRMRAQLRTIPGLLSQAERNLTEADGDLATIAIRVKEKDVQLLEGLRGSLEQEHADLIADVDAAIAATRHYERWLTEHRDHMTAAPGVGREAYDWWMRNVHLIPYSWDQLFAMMQAEYGRAIAFLKLEEHRHRKLPDFEITASAEENERRQREAAQRLLDFLRDEEIITVPSDLPPLPADQFPRVWGMSAYLRPDDRGFFEETNDREPMTNVAHVFFGHYYVGGRKIWYQDGDTRPIRGEVRLYDMHEARSEALAFGIEEWLLQAGLFDERPRSREITYIWLAFRAIRALTDLRMHACQLSLAEGLHAIAGGIPYPWADADSDAVWWDTEETLRAPGHSSNYVVGRNMMQGLLADRAHQLGADFSIRRFFDEFMGGGIVPIALSRWELTGDDDQLQRLLDGD